MSSRSRPSTHPLAPPLTIQRQTCALNKLFIDYKISNLVGLLLQGKPSYSEQSRAQKLFYCIIKLLAPLYIYVSAI